MYKKYVTSNRLFFDWCILVINRNDNTRFVLLIVSLIF